MEKEVQASFERLWDSSYGRVVRVAYLMVGDEEDAADLAQDAFCLAWRKWHLVSRLEHPEVWIQVAVTKLALNWRRKRRLRRRLAAEPPGLSSEPRMRDPELLVALKELPEAQRAVVVLRYYVDLSVDEVARRLGKKPGTVRALSHQALTKLRNLHMGSEVSTDAQ